MTSISLGRWKLSGYFDDMSLLTYTSNPSFLLLTAKIFSSPSEGIDFQGMKNLILPQL